MYSLIGIVILGGLIHWLVADLTQDHEEGFTAGVAFAA